MHLLIIITSDKYWTSTTSHQQQVGQLIIS
jgi:hypothetical protein